MTGFRCNHDFCTKRCLERVASVLEAEGDAYESQFGGHNNATAIFYEAAKIVRALEVKP